MTTRVKVRGMSAPMSFTCEDSVESNFWVKSGLPEDQYKKLFDKAKSEDSFWKQEITAAVEGDGFGLHNSVINGIATAIFINGKKYE
jgi:hypothetical protein